MTIGDRFSMYEYNILLRLAGYGVTCPLERFRYFGSDTNDTSNPVGLQDPASPLQLYSELHRTGSNMLTDGRFSYNSQAYDPALYV